MIQLIRRGRMRFLIITAFLVIALSSEAALAKKYEKEDLDELEWFEFLMTDFANLSAPGSDNIYYAISAPRHGSNGVRWNYGDRIKDLADDKITGYEMYDGLGVLEKKTATFYYNKPKSRTKHVGRLVYNYYHAPFWYVKQRSKEEMEDWIVSYLLRGSRSHKPIEPVTRYKETKGGVDFNVIEYEYKEKNKPYKGQWYFLVNDDYSLTNYFFKTYQSDSKYADTTNEVFDHILTSSVLKDLNSDMHYVDYMLYSAREIIFNLNDKKDEKEKDKKDRKKNKKDAEQKTMSSKLRSTGEEKTYSLEYEGMKDFVKCRNIMNEELDKLAKQHPDNPKIHFAQAVYSEYNDTGERYGEGYDKAGALKYYKKAIDADKLFFYAYYNSGILHALDDNRKEALEYFKKCIEISPVDILSLYRLGALYEKENDYIRAYEHYWKAKNALTFQEKSYCPAIKKKLWKACNSTRKKAKVEKLKKKNHKKVAQSTMARYFNIDPEPLVRMANPDYGHMGGNAFSYNDDYVFWHGYLRGDIKKADVTAIWYTPDGKVFKEEDAASAVAGDSSSYYFLLPIVDSEPAKKLGSWKIDVYLKGELIDTKHFYILDC